MSTKRRPIVCAIDLGYEFTKVSVRFPVGDNYPYEARHLRWPSSDPAHALRTTVVYTEGKLEIGTKADDHSQAASEVFEHFKLKALSAERYGRMVIPSNGESPRPASEIMLAFLCRLYIKIRDNICDLRLDATDRWGTMDIDFAFSVPSIVGHDGATTLTSMAKECNFEEVKGLHKVIDVEITEPEAAGVYLLGKHKSHIQRGDVAMVLDLGGGTSDLSMIAMGKDDKWKLDGDLVCPISSDRFGAASIDRSVRALIEEYALRHNLDARKATSIATDVLKCEGYLAAKIKMQPLDFNLGSTRISAEETAGEIHVENDKLIFRRVADERITYRALFTRLLDELIYGVDCSGDIAGLASTMRDDLYARSGSGVARGTRVENSLRGERDTVKIDHVFFAGGLGGSAYLRGKVQEELLSTGKAVGWKLEALTKDTFFHGWDEKKHHEAQLCVTYGIADHRVEGIMQDEGKPRFRFRSWLRSLAL